MDWADATDLTPKADRPGVRRLLKTADTTVVAFAFGPGQGLREHTAAHPILLTCASGAVDFEAAGEVRRLANGQVIRLDARVPHAVHAPDGALMLLTMLHQHEAEQLPEPVAEALESGG